jgi:3-oxoacyl-[acyl-carrier-protein] synthase I
VKRVVITGTGIYSVIGKTLDEVTVALKEGRSGIGIDPVRKEMGFRSALTGLIERPKLKGEIPRRMRVCLPEQGEYAYIATKEALVNAMIGEEFLEKNSVGVIYGNDSSSIPVIEAIDNMRENKDTMLIGSGSIFQSMNSTVTMNLAVIFKLKGINFTVSAACASGSHAIGLGYIFIKNGMQKMIV